MTLIENKDYRVVGNTAYVRLSLKKEGYTKGSEVYLTIEKLWRKGYHIEYAPDSFILTGKRNSPF